MAEKLTIGQEFLERNGIPAFHMQGELADEIDAAIADAFKTGFEHACVGGKEAARKLPQLKAAMPLVLYFANEKDRQEFVDMIHEVKPHMVEIKIPERSDG